MPSDRAAPSKSKKRRGRPPGGNSEESRRRILEVAERHLAEYGYAATTVKEVAHEAGITGGAVYHYFPSKIDLMIAVYRQSAMETVDQLWTRVDENASLIDNVTSILEYSELYATEETRRRASLVLSMIADVPLHPELRPVVYEANRLRNFFEALVDAAAARGELPRDFEPSAIVNLLFAVMRGITAEFVYVASDEQHRETLRAFQRLIRGNLFSVENPISSRSGVGPGDFNALRRDARRADLEEGSARGSTRRAASGR